LGIRVLIPAYNESRTIGEILDQVKSLGLSALVIDDGSVDNTFNIAIDKKVEVLRHLKNMGKGASLREGFQDTIKKNFEAVIVMDGDGQHDPSEITKFINESKQQDADIIVGNRMHDTKTMPFKRKLTNKFMSYLISKITKQNIPDTQCGYRLIKTKVLKNIKFSTSNYEIESELLIRAARKGCHIHSIPIKTIYKDEKSQINPVVDTIRFFSFLFKILTEKKENV